MTRTTADVVARFNQALTDHGPALTADLVASARVMETDSGPTLRSLLRLPS
ncbi:hypothetical protein GCM10025864_26980 [Luteimicrobium album]|uniref:Uncharacterized protein n=1 Tax=Luteimicrobium album TaxID=1054550 RepID=A0ABQ6I2G1_9MICO|nr:hypothetical protein [Luteimicrobium album]GMA24939.1 hypothetical protein GCM10025864_26980 [Luteimicrobium album]